MSAAVLACMVCARPLDALLTMGLHAGVMAMALVTGGVIAMVARGVARLLREDRDALERGVARGDAP